MPAFIAFFLATWYALDFLEASAFLALISADMLGSCGALEPLSPPDGPEDLETRPNPEDLEDLVRRVAPVGMAVMLLAAAVVRLALLLRAEEVVIVEVVSTVLPPDSAATVLATSLDLPDLRLDAFGACLDFGTLVALQLGALSFFAESTFLLFALAFAFAFGLSPPTSATDPVDRFDFLFFGGGQLDPQASGSW